MGLDLTTNDDLLVRNKSCVFGPLVANLTICSSPESYTKSRNAWLISLLYAFDVIAQESQLMSGRLKSPASHIVAFGFCVWSAWTWSLISLM